MSDLRKNLQAQLNKRGWNAYDLESACEKIGCRVHQPTIQRFLSGKHGDPRGDTVRKLAKGLGITEAELRGLSNTPQQPTCAQEIDSNAEWLGGFETWDNDTPLRDDEVELPFFREVELAAGAVGGSRGSGKSLTVLAGRDQSNDYPFD